jgi:catechol 2,3-dioxygenase-like lactoylglutathione lyase family enzyme
MVELLEYTEPLGDDFSLRNCDVGAVHVAFEVDDVQEAYDALKELDVNFSSEPVFDPREHFVYFRDPDGIQLELYKRPLVAPT